MSFKNVPFFAVQRLASVVAHRCPSLLPHVRCTRTGSRRSFTPEMPLPHTARARTNSCTYPASPRKVRRPLWSILHAPRKTSYKLPSSAHRAGSCWASPLHHPACRCHTLSLFFASPSLDKHKDADTAREWQPPPRTRGHHRRCGYLRCGQFLCRASRASRGRRAPASLPSRQAARTACNVNDNNGSTTAGADC